MASRKTPPKPPRNPRDDARSAFRQSLLRTAEGVLADMGFQAAKMSDIAAAAGVAVGTLYNYFESKEQIFESIVAERSAELRAQVAAAIAEAPPLERLRLLVRAVFSHLDAHRALFEVFVERGAVGECDFERVGGSQSQQEYEHFLELLTEAVRAAVRAGDLRKDIPATTMASALSGAMNGVIYAWFRQRKRGPLADGADELFELFASGARPRS